MSEPDVDPTLAAAIQAAALAGDYPLAITLVREHGLQAHCLTCVGVVNDSFAWQSRADAPEHALKTCTDCSEHFARRYVSSKGPLRGRPIISPQALGDL